jgi:acetyl esterase/lipase
VDYKVNPQKIALMGDSAGGNLCAVLSQRALRAGNPKMIKCQVLLYPVIHCLDMQSPSYRYYYDTYNGAALLNPAMLTRWLLMYVGVDARHINLNTIRSVLNNHHLSSTIKTNNEIKAVLDHNLLPSSMRSPPVIICDDEKIVALKAKRSQENLLPESNFVHEEITTKLVPLLTNPDLCPILGKNLEGLAAAMICTVGVDILRDEGVLYAQKLRSYGVPVRWNHYESAFHGVLHMPLSKQRKQLIVDITSYLKDNL